ncbi:MAG: RnfABCDGE type electron transport complex subunit B [Reinekea sp.]
MITATITLLLIATVCGAILGFAAIRFKPDGDPLVDQIDAILPQTQCGQCGHPGCRPYAEGIADGEPINKCPPGGEATIQALADLLDVEPMPLDAEHGEEKGKQVAVIREQECIGCTKCIQAMVLVQSTIRTWYTDKPTSLIELIATDRNPLNNTKENAA